MAVAPPVAHAAAAAAAPRARPAARAGNVRSLADLAASDSDDDDDGPIETFIGGAKRHGAGLGGLVVARAGLGGLVVARAAWQVLTHAPALCLPCVLFVCSGQMVQDPKKNEGKDRVTSMFESAAKQANTTTGRPEDLLPGGGDSGSKAFQGTGRTLSGVAPPPPPPAPPAPPAPVMHTITFYHNGFTVNAGPLRRLDDPANAPFMEAIAAGMYPEELRPADLSTPVHVNLVRKDEDWVAPPEPKYTAFSGSGRTLGAASAEAAPGAGAAAGAGAGAPVAGAWEVDESAPVTSLQLRLLDGSRVVARFNAGHTVAHIRAFIERLRPGTGAVGVLQVAGMPPKTLTDMGATLADAGLLNAVVIQKA